MANLDDMLMQLHPEPDDFDPEVDREDVTVAQLSAKEEGSNPAVLRSLLRRKAAASLAATDSRYRGKKVSRQSLMSTGTSGSDSDSNGDDEDDDDNQEEDNETAGDDNEIEEEAEEIEEEEITSEEEVHTGSDNEDEDDKDEEAGDDEEIPSSEADSDAGGVVQEEKDEWDKAKAVVEQLDMWDTIMETRIKLQKVFSLINKLPAGPQRVSIQQETAEEMLTSLTCHLCGLGTASSKKRKIDDIEEAVKDNFSSYETKRNEIISFWDDRTRLTNKKFKFGSFSASAVKQVEQILSDRDRLIRRTQVSRDACATEVEAEETFDDLDFYQRQLRELVDSKSEDQTSCAPQSQWLEIQQLKTVKKKKDVDTRASKGRKLRYNIHAKLVNFMTASDDSTWSEEAKNELFKNLFK